MNLLNKIKIKFSSNKIGIDEFGNSYFEKKHSSGSSKKKRFVIYRGEVEASKVPSQWHRWLHYTCDEAPINIDTNKNSWQKIHLPNLTGTVYKHSLTTDEGKRRKVGSDYEAWKPNK